MKTVNTQRIAEIEKDYFKDDKFHTTNLAQQIRTKINKEPIAVFDTYRAEGKTGRTTLHYTLTKADLQNVARRFNKQETKIFIQYIIDNELSEQTYADLLKEKCENTIHMSKIRERGVQAGDYVFVDGSEKGFDHLTGWYMTLQDRLVSITSENLRAHGEPTGINARMARGEDGDTKILAIIFNNETHSWGSETPNLCDYEKDNLILELNKKDFDLGYYGEGIHFVDHSELHSEANDTTETELTRALSMEELDKEIAELDSVIRERQKALSSEISEKMSQLSRMENARKARLEKRKNK